MDFQRGIAERVQDLIDAFGFAGLAAVIFVGIVAMTVVLLRGAGPAIFILMVAYAFAAAPGIGTLAFFARILALVLILVAAGRRFVMPGLPFMFLMGYASLGVAFSIFSQDVMWSVQKGATLMLSITAVTLGVGSYLESPDKVSRLYRMFVVAGLVWMVTGLAFVPQFLQGGGARFAGGADTTGPGGAMATGFAHLGALTLPFMLWALLQKEFKIWRLLALGGLLFMPILIFLSGTRTGLAVVVIAGAPLLIRGGLFRSAKVWAGMAIAVFIVFMIGAAMLQDRGTEFLAERFTSTDLSGREERWQGGIDACMESPLMGTGIGSDDLAGFQGAGLFHNGYLSVWYNTGLFGLLLVVGVLTMQIIRAFFLIRRAKSDQLKDLCRLSLGIILAEAAMAMFTTSLASPSNSTVVILFIMIVVVERLRTFVEAEEAAEASPYDAKELAAYQQWPSPLNTYQPSPQA